jgi:predicted SnoaL-like aldol condensation-catalyzing enzyme
MSKTTPKQNKALVLEAFDTLFNKRDYEAAKRYWSDCYIQHSAHIAPGRDGLFDLVRTLPDTSKYENHIILAEGDFVITHGRFSGNGRQAAWVAADVVRMEDGKLAEHWDVLQDEATKEESKSGLPMFGTSFPKPDPQSAPAGTDSSLGVEEARRIVSPLYDALNQPSKKDVPALLAKATNPDYRSYHTNEEWLTRDQLRYLRTLVRLSPICTGQLRTSKRSVTKSWYVAKRPGHLQASFGERSRPVRALRQWRLMCSR